MKFYYLSKCLFFVLLLLGAKPNFAQNNSTDTDIAKPPAFVIPESKLLNLNHPDRVPNAFIVVFKDDSELETDVPPALAARLTVAPSILPTTADDIAQIGYRMAGKYRSTKLIEHGEELSQIRHAYSKALRGFSLDGVSDENAALLAKDPRIKYVEAVISGRVTDVQTEYSAPWDLDRLDQAQGLNTTYDYLLTGHGVTVWVLDSGVQFSHTEFAGRAGTYDISFTLCGQGQTCSNNYYNVCTDSGSVCSHYYIVQNNSGILADECGHGTAVASAAGGNISGVAKGASIIGVSVLNSGCNIGTDVAIAGIDYVINHKAANNIINFSIEIATNDYYVATFENAVAAAVNAGIVFISSAGNDNSNACAFDPGRLSYVITVGASSKTDQVSSYSNYGPCVTLFAPGDNVTVADNGRDTNVDQPFTFPDGSNTGINTISGTSFSAPLVAGIAALYLEAYPGASPANVKQAITSAAWQGKLTDTRTYALPSANLLASPCVAGNLICQNGTANNSAAGFAVQEIIDAILLVQ